MAKFDITWWAHSQYGRTVEADTIEEAWENIWKDEVDNPVNVLYVSDEPYDIEIEEV